MREVRPRDASQGSERRATRPRMARRGVAGSRAGSGAVLALAAAVALWSAGCQAHAQAVPQQARGLVINVQARSIAETEVITIRTDDGRELTLRVDRAADMTPGHLREHMALGQPVVVTYQQTPDGLLATRIDDG
jgi:hypothetical protein